MPYQILHKNSDFYRILFENANDAIVLLDNEARVVEVNDANSRLVGYSRDELMGKSVFEMGIFAQEELKKHLEIMTFPLTESAKQGIWEVKLLHKNGTPILVEFSVNVVKEAGEPIGLLTIARDVTDRRHIEQALQESEEMKRILLNTTTDAVMLLDPEGNILDLNAAFAEKFDKPISEIIGLCLWDLHSSQTYAFKEKIQSVVTTGKAIRYEDEIHGKWTDNIIYPVSDIEGKRTRIAVFSHDISQAKKAEEELRQHRDHLKEKIKERTLSLEQTNTALKVLLKKREEDKTELEDKMIINVNELILPYIEKLKKTPLKNEHMATLEVVEYNLKNIISPFVKTLNSKFYNLTPTEINIANLIKQGKSSKEMAGQLKMSARTIDTHRYHIRRKLGINNEKANLRTHLLSIN